MQVHTKCILWYALEREIQHYLANQTSSGQSGFPNEPSDLVHQRKKMKTENTTYALTITHAMMQMAAFMFIIINTISLNT